MADAVTHRLSTESREREDHKGIDLISIQDIKAPELVRDRVILSGTQMNPIESSLKYRSVTPQPLVGSSGSPAFLKQNSPKVSNRDLQSPIVKNHNYRVPYIPLGALHSQKHVELNMVIDQRWTVNQT